MPLCLADEPLSSSQTEEANEEVAVRLGAAADSDCEVNAEVAGAVLEDRMEAEEVDVDG